MFLLLPLSVGDDIEGCDDDGNDDHDGDTADQQHCHPANWNKRHLSTIFYFMSSNPILGNIYELHPTKMTQFTKHFPQNYGTEDKLVQLRVCPQWKAHCVYFREKPSKLKNFFLSCRKCLMVFGGSCW